MNGGGKMCLALDGLSLDESLGLLKELAGRSYAIKLHALLDQEGPSVIRYLRHTYSDSRVWVDYKVHDTKDTVGYRVAALFSHGADIVTVHASGGVPMMQEAVKAAGNKAEIWAITVLTSLNDEEILAIYGRERTEAVTALAHLAKKAGVAGLVCSALEVGMLSADPFLSGLKLIVPGTRSVGVALGQQRRSGTPRQAILDGATHLVAGSQVTKAADRRAAFEAMEAEARGE